MRSPQMHEIHNFENRTLFPLPELHTPILPVTPMPKGTPNLVLPSCKRSPSQNNQQSTSSELKEKE